MGDSPGINHTTIAVIAAAPAAPQRVYFSGTNHNAPPTTAIINIHVIGYETARGMSGGLSSAQFAYGKRDRASLRIRRGVFKFGAIAANSVSNKPAAITIRSPAAAPKASIDAASTSANRSLYVGGTGRCGSISG